MKTTIIISILCIAIAFGALFFWKESSPEATIADITNFDECIAAGYPALRSQPMQCQTADGRTFTQEIDEEDEKEPQHDLIRLTSPAPNSTATSPIEIAGEARGTWFFEATFPVRLEDAAGNTVAEHYAEATAEWMTEEFVPFTGELTIPETFSGQAILVLEKSNPSGLPEHEESIRVPITIVTQ